MSSLLWLSLILVCLLGALSPGPSLVVVVRETVSSGRRNGVIAGCSHALGVGLWALMTIHGLALLITRQQTVYSVLGYMGAAYLAYLGVQAWRHAGDSDLACVESGRQHTAWMAARQGILISLTNPKLALFFIALFSQFVGANQTALTHWGMILIATLIDGGWYTLVALLLSHPRPLALLRRHAGAVERLSGTLFLILALRVITL